MTTLHSRSGHGCGPPVPDGDIAVVTHSRGGLIFQRYLAWMVGEGRGRELARIELTVLLACPNAGTEYLSSIRAVMGFNRHPQARDLTVLNARITDTCGGNTNQRWNRRVVA